MEAKIVSFKEISNPIKNPTFCLSAKRYVGHCASCRNLMFAFEKYKTIEKTIKYIKCKPNLSKEAIDLLKRKTELLKELETVKKQLSNVNAEIQ